MIDSQSESILTFQQVADDLPRRRRGRKTHVSTIYRWASTGCRGVVLETIQIGATRCTSREALQRFFERLTADRSGRGCPGPGEAGPARTAAKRLRDSKRAERTLIDSGA
jgi:hypothetical protein